MSDTTPLVVVVPLGSMDASASEEQPVFYAPVACRILGCWIIDTAAKTGHADNKGTYTLTDKGAAAAGTTVVATRVTDTPTTDDIAANVAWPVTLSTTDANLNVDAGSVLTFKATEAGTAGSGDLTDAKLVLSYVIGQGYGD